MLLCVLWCAALGLSAPAYAAPPAPIALQACIKPVLSGETAQSVAGNPAAFDCSTAQSKKPSGSYWVRLDARGNASNLHDPLKLRTASVWADGHEITAFYADGSEYRFAAKKHQTGHYLFLGAALEFPLASKATSLKTIMVRVENAANIRGVLLAPKLVTTSRSAADERNLAGYYGAFAGLCLALLIYNLALWRGMRSPFQLAYGAMVVTLLAYAFTSSGAAAYAFPELLNQDRLRINYILLSLAAATALIFLRHLLEDDILPKWFIRAAWVQAFLLVIAGAAFAVFAPHMIKLLDAIYFIIFTPLPLFFFASVYYGWKRQSRFIGYMLVAWSAPVAVAAARTLHGMGFIPYHFLLDNSSLIAMTFEALVSSMAIGQRIRSIARDRDQALAAERIANLVADMDSLTGLLTRRAFVRELMAEPRDWQLALVDIDHFKRVNDTLGHVEGDEVLVQVANALRAHAPEASLVARLGGEEFAIATIASRDGQGLFEPDKMLNAIRRTNMPGGYRITVSIGLARRVLCEEMDWKILYRAADMALYRAKADGRDRHVDYSAERIAA